MAAVVNIYLINRGFRNVSATFECQIIFSGQFPNGQIFFDTAIVNEGKCFGQRVNLSIIDADILFRIFSGVFFFGMYWKCLLTLFNFLFAKQNYFHAPA